MAISNALDIANGELYSVSGELVGLPDVDLDVSRFRELWFYWTVTAAVGAVDSAIDIRIFDPTFTTQIGSDIILGASGLTGVGARGCAIGTGLTSATILTGVNTIALAVPSRIRLHHDKVGLGTSMTGTLLVRGRL